MLKNFALLCLLPFLCNQLIADQEPSTATSIIQSEEFSKGYIQAKLEDRFPSVDLKFAIENKEIIIYQYPEEDHTCENIRLYLEEFEGYRVRFDDSYDPVAGEESPISTVNGLEGNWLPELTSFFPTMLANPHIIGYSAGYRSYDRIFKSAILPTSMGDRFTIYQFKTHSRGHLYLGIEAAVWAVFEAQYKSLSLLNADYYVAVPLTYINNRFSLRLRLFHESSHLGDELLEEKNIKRYNPSKEVLDLFVAYDFTDNLTVFGGIGRVLRCDEVFKIQPLYVVYGFNYHLNYFKIKLANLEATPYIGVYLSNAEDNAWALDTSVTLGYEWDKSYGRKMRLYLEGRDGFSNEGQFSKLRTKYLALKLIYAY